jgi:hypothetical protein
MNKKCDNCSNEMIEIEIVHSHIIIELVVHYWYCPLCGFTWNVSVKDRIPDENIQNIRL